MATERQIEANRRNARASTGPRSEGGKAACRGNARTHGLAGATAASLDPAEVDEVARRTAEWTAVLRPRDAIESFHVAQYALESVRVECCQGEERVLRRRLALHASDAASWDEDRRREAEEVGARLARDPARTVRRLRQTPQGCDWLIGRWQALALALEAGRPWDDPLRALAHDLLGTPAPFRDGPTPLDPPPDSPEGAAARATQAALATTRIAELARLRDEVMRPRDEDDRALASLGIDPGGTSLTRALRLIRRYEAACQRRLERALRLLLDGRASSPAAGPAPRVAPAPAVAPRPESAPLAAPEPLLAARDAPRPDRPAAEPDPAIAPDPPRGNRRWRRAQQRLARRHAG